MLSQREIRQQNRETELQRVYDLATSQKQRALTEIEGMYQRAIALRHIIAASEETIEQCKIRAIEQGVLHIL